MIEAEMVIALFLFAARSSDDEWEGKSVRLNNMNPDITTSTPLSTLQLFKAKLKYLTYMRINPLQF